MAARNRLLVLTYDYVDDILERRVPHREAHLAHAGAWRDRGALLLGGAVGDPPHSAMLVFDVEDPAEVRAFAEADPYLHAGLVTDWRIEPWAAVIRGDV